MEVGIVIVAAIAYLGFRHWLQLQRRMMLHRERLAALEKGAPLPPMEQEVRRSGWNVQRLLLLAGFIWISLGIGVFVLLTALLFFPSPQTQEIPRGLQWIGVGPVCIGLSHLIVYAIGKRKEM
jgi:hypothetical protein